MLKVVAKKLESTKGKVSLEWKHYRQQKQKIKARKTLSKSEKKQVIISELDLTRRKISNKWIYYQEVKQGLIYKSPYSGFNYKKKLVGITKEIDGEEKFFKFKDSYQKIYKAKRNFDTNKLDSIVPKILANKKVRGVLIVVEVTTKDDETMFASNYINNEELKRIRENNNTVFEYVAERLRKGDTKAKELKFIYMRIIYEKQI